MSVFLRNLCLPENAEAIDNARYSMIIEVEAHTRMTFLASILQNLGPPFHREARHQHVAGELFRLAACCVAP